MSNETDKVVLEDDEDLSTLTDAEREAMNLDLDEEDAPVVEDELGDDDPGEEEQEELPLAAQAPESEPEPELSAEPEPVVEEPVVAAPERSSLPESAEPDGPNPQEVALGELKESLKAIKAEYREGNLDTDEYLERRDEIQEKRSDIQWEMREAELLYKAQAQATEKAEAASLQKATDEFYANNPDYAKSKGLQSALDAHWQDVWSDPKWQNKSYSARLEEARSRSDADVGRVTTPVAQNVNDNAAARKAAVKGRGKQPTTPTLADVPNADESTAESGGRFADLSNLDGIDLEKALAKKIEQHGEGYLDEWLTGTAH